MNFKNISTITIYLLFMCFFLNSCDVEKDEIEVNININDDVKRENKNLSKEYKDLTLYIATDLHYLSNKINDKGEAFQLLEKNLDGRQINYIEEILNAFVYEIQENNPDVLIISGDLTHNGELISHKDLAEMFTVIESFGTEVLIIPGNHDINNPWARGFEKDKQVKVDSVTKEEFKNIYNDFGFSKPQFKDNETLSYVSEVSDDLWILMLDTAIYNKNISYPTTNGKLSKGTLKWIDDVVNEANKEEVEIITVMHHNLYNHSDLLYKGFTLDNAEEVLQNFKKNNLNLVFSGHIHIQNIATEEENLIYDIANSALTIYPIQYGVVNYSETGFEYYTQRLNVDKWATDNNIQDTNLLNFNEYKETYFYEKSYNKVYASLLEKKRYTEKELEEMSNTMALLNLNYFAGTVTNVKGEILKSKGYELWLEEDDSFIKKYILSMLTKSKEDKNYLNLK